MRRAKASAVSSWSGPCWGSCSSWVAGGFTQRNSKVLVLLIHPCLVGKRVFPGDALCCHPCAPRAEPELWDPPFADTRSTCSSLTHTVSHCSPAVNPHKHSHSRSLANKPLVPQRKVACFHFVSALCFPCDAAEESSVLWLGVIKITGEMLSPGGVKWGTAAKEGPKLEMRVLDSFCVHSVATHHKIRG